MMWQAAKRCTKYRVIVAHTRAPKVCDVIHRRIAISAASIRRGKWQQPKAARTALGVKIERLRSRPGGSGRVYWFTFA